MSIWEDLETARQALLLSHRSRVRSWLVEALPALKQRFQEGASAALEALLEAAANHRCRWDPDSSEEQLLARLCQSLESCQAEVARNLQSEAEGLARTFGSEARRALAAQLGPSPKEDPAQEDTRSGIAMALQASPWRWEPPALGRPLPPAFNLALRPSFLRPLLPGRWARRRMIAQARAGLPAAIMGVSGELERVAQTYWDGCLESLDQALGLCLQQVQSANQRGAPLGRLGEREAMLAVGSGCIICAESWRNLYAFFSQFQHTLATDPEARNGFRAANGLCASHLWLLERFSSPRGLCAGLPDLLEGFAKRLAELPGEGGAEGGLDLLPRLADPGSCLACQTLERSCRDAVERLRLELSEPEAFRQEGPLPDLCLQHLPLVLAWLGRGQGAGLARHLGLRLARVAEAMAGYSLKFDARRRDLLSDEERRAYRDALDWLAGDRNLSGHPGVEY